MKANAMSGAVDAVMELEEDDDVDVAVGESTARA